MAYYLQTPPGVLIILVRHGRTALNNTSKPSVRGWKDDPLEGDSLDDVKRTASQLKQFEPQWIASSDFMRDTQTAMILADQLGIADKSTDYEARTWDVGEFSGHPENEVGAAIKSLYRRPWDTPPGSLESFNEFSARWTNYLERKEQLALVDGMKPGIIVTHGRNIALTDAFYNFKVPEDGTMPVPAGFAVLSVAQDRSISLDFGSETECVCVDF